MAIVISILDSNTILGPDGSPVIRTADIEIVNNGGTSYFLKVGNIPVAGGMQAHLNGRASELHTMAESLGVVLDVTEQVKERIVTKALVALILDEINTLRAAAVPPLTPQYTLAQVRKKLRDKIMGV